jgi:hypothetical protein
MHSDKMGQDFASLKKIEAPHLATDRGDIGMQSGMRVFSIKTGPRSAPFLQFLSLRLSPILNKTPFRWPPLQERQIIFKYISGPFLWPTVCLI